MKKRIIASILVLVMSIAALASCAGSGFDFAEDSYGYVDGGIDVNKILEALAKIEIEDGKFTTDEDTRNEQVEYDIYDKLTSSAVTAAGSDRLTEGTLTNKDVLYFVYYVTLDVKDSEGNVTETQYFYGNQMDAGLIDTGSSSVKAMHTVKLATVNNGTDEFLKALAAALAEKFDDNGALALTGEGIDLMYKTSKEAVAVKEGETIVISYTRTYKDDSDVEQKEVRSYMTLTLDKTKYEEGSEEALLALKLLDEKTTAIVGSKVSIDTTPEGSTDKSSSNSFKLTIAEEEYTYTDVTVNWKTEKDNGALVSFTYTPTSTDSQERNELHNSTAAKVDLKGKELTYHVYPVSYVDVPDITAESIILNAIGTSIKTTSLDIFADETYKTGDKTIKSMIESLAKIYSKDAETMKTLKDAKGEKTLEALSKALDDAKAALKAADSKADNYDELEKDVEEAQDAYDAAVEYNKELQVAEIVRATSGDKKASDEIVKQYKEMRYDSLEAAYNLDIKNKVSDAVWDIIDKNVVIKTYPTELIDELYDELYESYEYKFYTGNYSQSTSTAPAVSNYDQYNGSLEAYLIGTTKKSTYDEAVAAIRAEAEDYAEPMLKIFALAYAMEQSSVDVSGKMNDLVNNKHLTYEEFETFKESWDSATEESVQNYWDYMTTWGDNFLVDDAAMKHYKKYLGNARYKLLISDDTASGGIGKRNAYAAQQLDRLMFYFLAMDVNYDADGKPTEFDYKDGKLPFVNISYSIKAEAEADK